MLKLGDVTQKPGDKDVEFKSRLNRAATRCGNFHSTDEKMKLFLNGMDLFIKNLVARPREMHCNMIFMEVV